MNNNFVVDIPKELKSIKSKLFFGLTKRQLIGFGIAAVLGIGMFLMLKSISPDVAMYGLFIVAAPVIFITIFTKDGLPAEQWIKLWIEYNYISTTKRYFKVSKKNISVAKERKIFKERSTSNGEKPIEAPKPISSVATTD